MSKKLVIVIIFVFFLTLLMVKWRSISNEYIVSEEAEFLDALECDDCG